MDYYTDFDESIEQMLKTRKDGGFTDAWVRIMKEGYTPPVTAQIQGSTELKQEIVPAPIVDEVRIDVGKDEVFSNKVEIKVDVAKRDEASSKESPTSLRTLKFYFTSIIPPIVNLLMAK
ncbi:MAG: hypothetical protein U5K54_26535 [Cytophagales bacterium]|nr:hypothetical protein [Cytophagales bacterium]